MNRKSIVLLFFLALLFLAIFIASKFTINNKGSALTISPNILYLTQPITTFSGTVTKIEGNKLVVSQKQTLAQNIAPPATPIPTPKIVTVTYQVVITDKTQMSRPVPYINYLFKTITPVPMAKLTIKDVKVGQYVTVNSQTDLRTLKENTFEAIMVNLSQIPNTLNGRIVSVEENTLTLKAFAPVAAGVGAGNTPPSAPQEKEYSVNITSDTEISRMTYPSPPITPGQAQSPKPEKLNVSSLKKDMQVTIYTAEDVIENTRLTALRIEPLPQAP